MTRPPSLHRRTLLGLAAAATTVAIAPRAAAQGAAPSPIARGRPQPADRRFNSPAVEAEITRIKQAVSTSPTGMKIAALFANCFPNTLDTTVEFTPGTRPDTFVITGDIDAMWLRDSTAQVWPYLPLMKRDARLQSLVAGVVNRQTLCVLRDPYANAFYKDGTRTSEWASDETEMKPGIHERKWEVDSLCSAIRLAHGYWRASSDVSPFDDAWAQSSRLILRTFREQQRKDGVGPYRFQRRTSWNPDSVPVNGYGNPVRPVGLIVSLFRPSDDAAIVPFLVPANQFAVVSLRQLATMHETIRHDAAFAGECRALASEVEDALLLHALADRPGYGRVWPYEVDGYGNALFIDDANVPNLMSLPYLGWCDRYDADYRRTRALILSNDNPWFRKGKAAEGIGSPHTPQPRIWPIAIAMRGLTSVDDDEILDALRMLAATDAGTGFMHEAFDKDDPSQFTRPWFAWANTLFGEFVLQVADERPHLLRAL